MLRENGIEPEIVEYLKEPLDAETIAELIEQMGMKPRELLRKREKDYKELGLADTSLNPEELIAAMASHPKLIERPIVVGPKGTVMGRPTEKILEVI